MFALQELLDLVKISGCSLIVWPSEQVRYVVVLNDSLNYYC